MKIQGMLEDVIKESRIEGLAGMGCVGVGVGLCLSVRSFLPPRASRPRNIGTYVLYVFTATQKNFYNVIFAKNAWFRSYGIICLPRMPPTTLKPQTTDTKGIS